MKVLFDCLYKLGLFIGGNPSRIFVYSINGLFFKVRLVQFDFRLVQSYFQTDKFDFKILKKCYTSFDQKFDCELKNTFRGPRSKRKGIFYIFFKFDRLDLIIFVNRKPSCGYATQFFEASNW
jgi:hypothetical protein